MDLNLLKSTVDQVHPLNEEAWATFSRLWQTSSFERGEYFARAGDFPTSMAFVQEGVFRAFYRNEEGTEYNKTFFIEGTLMAPLAALILRQENQINLQALTLAKVLTAP
ncbi:MAG: cyclic nucleotide-binding domain-containing protein, partial [Verrucomicrobiae bacterium]|nr:cyclic nucleotide-binding domain-containing protein [Verrucomicrobiae bacterium]